MSNKHTPEFIEIKPSPDDRALRNRIGIFTLATHILDTNTDAVMHMMRGVIVLIAERRGDYTQYVAIHADFDEIPTDCKEPPAYNYIVRQNEDGTQDGEWVKLGD